MSHDPRSITRRTKFPGSASQPVVTPLYPSVVYQSVDADALDAQYEGETKGYSYAREGHPNAEIVAQKVSFLEGCDTGIITGSGMAALTAVCFGVLKSGDHLVGGDQLYGRSMRMLNTDLPRFGIATSFADASDVEAVEAAIRPETRMILLEVVSNPTLRIADITGIAALAKSRGILLVIDNTFTTPRGFLPFEHGADIVIHSITKLLAGHSDVTLGYVAAREKSLMADITAASVTLGLTSSPFDCWLAERGLHSFTLRYDRAAESAAILADHIAGLAGVSQIFYPMRDDHPDHRRAVELLGDRGGNMVSFRLNGGRDVANRMIRAAEHIPFAPTLGDIGTTLSHPASSSHRGLSVAAREALGISEGFFRISVGIEDITLLKTEFSAAIYAAS